MSDATPSRAQAIAGIAAVLFNILGIVPLLDIGAAYKPGRLGEWLAAIPGHAPQTAASAWAFTLGVLAFPLFAEGIAATAPRSGWVVSGARLIALGGLLNATGTLAPFIVSHALLPACGADPACAPAALALLGWTLNMDALFNLLLGVGLLLVGVGWARTGQARALGLGAVITGLATAPVVGQVVSPACAAWLAVAGPLWLGWTALASARLWRLAGEAD